MRQGRVGAGINIARQADADDVDRIGKARDGCDRLRERGGAVSQAPPPQCQLRRASTYGAVSVWLMVPT